MDAMRNLTRGRLRAPPERQAAHLGPCQEVNEAPTQATRWKCPTDHMARAARSRPPRVQAPARSGCRRACFHACRALVRKTPKSRRAQLNSVDHTYSPRRIGGMVSGPGSTVKTTPARMQRSPARKTAPRHSGPSTDRWRSRLRHEGGLAGRDCADPPGRADAAGMFGSARVLDAVGGAETAMIHRA